MKYNFDEVIDRRNTNSMKVSGFREYLYPDAKEEIKFNYPDEELVMMWIADMEFALPQVIIDKMKERLDHRIFGYSKVFDDGYYLAFKNWCENKFGWSCRPEQLFSSQGVIPALYELVELLCQEDEKALTLTPGYSFYEHATNRNNCGLVCSALIKESDGTFKIDFVDFEKKAQDPKVSVLLFSNPHNPNGIVWTEAELKQIVEIAQANDLWVISDEIHCNLLRCGKKHIPTAKVADGYDKIITCMSPSKTFNTAGLMMSNIVIQNEQFSEVYKKHHYPFENPISIAAVKAAYEYGDEWLDQLKVYLDDNFAYLKKFLAERLPKAIFTIPEATYLAWVDFSAYFEKDLDLTLWFANEAGVLLESSAHFIQDGDGFVRLNLACPRSTLVDCLKKIEKAINENV